MIRELSISGIAMAMFCSSAALAADFPSSRRRSMCLRHSPGQVFTLVPTDPPPLNWSTLRYVFGHEKEDRNAEKAPQA